MFGLLRLSLTLTFALVYLAAGLIWLVAIYAVRAALALLGLLWRGIKAFVYWIYERRAEKRGYIHVA